MKLIRMLLVFLFLMIIFDVTLNNERFEDGSGIITATYCIPFTPCEGG